MDLKRSPVITDGPEYSRLSESRHQTHWYANGQTDPAVDRETRREQERTGSYRTPTSPSPVKGQRSGSSPYYSDSVEGLVKAIAKPQDPQDLSPKGASFKQAGTTSQQRDDEREQINLMDNAPDDEGSAPPSNDPGNPTAAIKPDGAHYIAAASIQDSIENRNMSSNQPLLPEQVPHRPGCCKALREKIRNFLLTPSVLVFFTLLFAFSLFCSLGLFIWLNPHLKNVIEEKVMLRPSTFSPSSPQQNAQVMLEVFFFNITYTTDDQGKHHIHTEDLGPYTYLVKSTKTDPIWHPNSTVSYQIEETFQFMPNHSAGSQDDVINLMDANVLDTLSKMKVENESKSYYFNLTSTSIKPQTVEDILMGEDDAENGRHARGLARGDDARNFFDIFTRRERRDLTRDSQMTNKSMSPMYNVHTGKRDMNKLNMVYTFNHSRANQMWPAGHDQYPRTGSADGDVFSPFISKDKTLAFFYSHTERNLLLQRQKSVKVNGREAYRFVVPMSSINTDDKENDDIDDDVDEDYEMTPQFSSADARDLSPVEDDYDIINIDDDDVDKTRPRQAFALQYLRRDSPFKLLFKSTSKKDRYGKGAKVCDIHLDIHPISGITLRKRLCHRMDLPVVFPGTKGPGFILPIMWVDWYYESIPEEDLDMMESTYDIYRTTYAAEVVAVVVAGVAFALVVIQMFTAIACHTFVKDVVLVE